MRKLHYAGLVGVGLTLAACQQPQEDIAPAPPVGPGALVGTVAADRDGDGIADGYYDASGNYYAFQAPPCPEPPPPPEPVYQPSPTGERG